jgi:2-octaprenyl-6-methoxyphenol hydroxylase
MHPKITILGCGLSGMITALSFAMHKIPVTIIESGSSKDVRFFKDIRTTALTSSSKKFFEHIGIWESLAKLCGPFNDIYVADNKAPNMLHLSSKHNQDNELMGYLIENVEFKKILFKAITNNELIDLHENTLYSIIKNTEDGCELLLNQKIKHECDLLIVCDGRASDARKQYFSSMLEKDYGQHAITFIVNHEKKHEGTALEHFMPLGPFAILPLKDQHLSSVVWTMSNSKKDAIMALPKDELDYIVQQNFGEFLGEISVEGEIAAFPLKAYETKEYYNKKIVLIADTAHIIHPLAGQGLNQGIKDIECLINLILQYGATSYMLESYQQERRADNNNMLELTDIINQTFSNHSKLFHAIRQIGFKAIEEIPFLKNFLIKYAVGKR